MRKLAVFLFAVAALAGGAYLAARLSRDPVLPQDQAVADIVKAALGELEKAYPPGAGLVRRDAHAKAHGCVKATFQVDPALPQDLRVGTFAEPGRRYKAWIRFSNGQLQPGADQSPDGRGLALKLIDADPDRPGSARKNPPHDILMVNFPAFFVADIPEYRTFMQLGALGGGFEKIKEYFIPGINPFAWRWHEIYVAYRNATRKIASPLRMDYYSMSAYGFGAAEAIKYATRPCAPAEATPPQTGDPDYLRHALRRELQAAPACFELFAQKRTGDLSVDDLTQIWPEDQAPMRRLGRLDLPVQDPGAESRDAICENMSFSPGHAPADEQPLGGLNIARIKVYAAIAAYRMGRNRVTSTDPEKAWDGF